MRFGAARDRSMWGWGMKARTDNPFAGPMTRADYAVQRHTFGVTIKRTGDAIYAASCAYFSRRSRVRFRRFWDTSPRHEYGTPGQVAHRARHIKRPKMVRVG